MAELISKHCADHSTTFLGICPLCARGAWPSRDLEAARDFNEKRLQAVAIPDSINYAEACRDLLDRLVEAERPVAEALAAAAKVRSTVKKDCKQAHANYPALTKAARIFAGIPGAEVALDSDIGEQVKVYLELLFDREIKW